MKYFFGLALLFASSVLSAQTSGLAGTEDAFVKALESVYEKRYQEAIPRLEAIYAELSSPQVAETLADAYYFRLEELAAQGDKEEIDGLYPEVRSNIKAMFAANPSKALFQSGVKSAFLLNDAEFASFLAQEYLKISPNDPAAESIAALAMRQSDSPDDIIQAYGSIARKIPASPEEAILVAQARWELARAYQMKNQDRLSLSYLRLADKIQTVKDLRLASLEFSFLNFPYAIAQMEQVGIKIFNRSQRTVYLGALFAEGSAESLKKMDALLSSEKIPTAYEEALSLHRRGINPRALLTLEQEKDPVVRRVFPWLYLDLRHKILSRLKDTENLIPVLESLGGQAYLVGKRELALSYLTNLAENEKGELSFLLGTIYAREKQYNKAKNYFLSHLKAAEAQYKGQALSELADIALQQGDFDAAEKYVSRYEDMNGEDTQDAAVPRGQVALKRGDYASAQQIFSEYFTQLYGENARKLAGYQISSIYLTEWMQTDKEILLPQAVKYIDAAYSISKNQQEGFNAFLDVNVFNLYAYCHAMADSEIGSEILQAAEFAAARSPTAEILDTAAVVFFRAGKIQGSTGSAEFYFTELEKELALMDDEIDYCKTLAPPYFDKTAEKNFRYYEIYTHLAAWHRYLGNEEQAQKAEKEALRLAEDKTLARRQMDWLIRTMQK